MTILKQIIEELGTDDKLQKLLEICDKIKKEEKETIIHIDAIPKGPNIFLSLEVPGKTKGEICFLTLEREREDLYLTVLYSISYLKYAKKDYSLKRLKVWEIHDNRPEKILTGYAKTYKFLKGE